LTEGIGIGYRGITRIGSSAYGPLSLNAKGTAPLELQNLAGSTGPVTIGTTLGVTGAVTGASFNGYTFNQSVATTAVPTFAGLAINGYIEVINATYTTIGTIYLGSGQTHYLQYDGSGSEKFYRLGGTEGLQINGAYALTTASAIPTSQVTGLDTALSGKESASNILRATATWNISTLVAWDYATIGPITVTGAAVGDPVVCAHPGMLSGLHLNAWVYSADTVYATVQNQTAGNITGIAGTLKIIVYK
jgi:hypothetical protein